MSKFRIYRADEADPALAGRKNKRMYISYLVMFFLVMLTLNISTSIGESRSAEVIYFIVLVILLLIAAYLIFVMKRQLKALKDIGILEFTKSSVKKQIGDLRSTWSYDKIDKIEIERHIRDLSITSSKTGSITHILKITHKDHTCDSFIISDKSIDFRQKTSICETLRILRKNAGLNTIVVEE